MLSLQVYCSLTKMHWRVLAYCQVKPTHEPQVTVIWEEVLLRQLRQQPACQLITTREMEKNELQILQVRMVIGLMVSASMRFFSPPSLGNTVHSCYILRCSWNKLKIKNKIPIWESKKWMGSNAFFPAHRIPHYVEKKNFSVWVSSSGHMWKEFLLKETSFLGSY